MTSSKGLAPCIRHLRDLVAIPSVNPMGRSDLPEEILGEREIAEHVAGVLGRIGLDAVLLGEGGRTSVLAEATVPGAAETLLVASHLDTVPVDGMDFDPFDPVIESGRLRGRGSCDTKSGMAALLEALARTLERGTLRRNLIVVGEADEELGSVGVVDVMRHLADRGVDWMIATEPTGLRLVHAHKGVVHARLCARGRACHSSDPSAGRNAIVALARAILAVEEGAASLAERRHPELGPATLSIGVVQGGQAPNVVPDEARIWIDRRTLPEERAADVRSELATALAGLEGEVEIERCAEEKPPLHTALDSTAVRSVAAALATEGLEARPRTVAFGTDAGLFARAGIPGVVIGPGSIGVAHTAHEFVPTDEVETMARLFQGLLESTEPLAAPARLREGPTRP